MQVQGPVSGSPLKLGWILVPLLSVVIGAIVCLLLNLIVQPTLLREDMPGAYYTYGAYDPETSPDGITYRWTTSHATLTFPYAAHLGRTLQVRLRLAGNRSSGQQSAAVTVSLNAQPQLHFDAAGGFEVYTATIDTGKVPNPYIDPSDVQVDIESTTMSVPGDARKLGVAVDWIEAQPERDIGEIVAEIVVWAMGILVISALALRKLGTRWCALYTLLLLITLVVIHLTYIPRAISLPVEIGLATLAWLIAMLVTSRAQPVWGLGIAGLSLWMLVAGQILGDWQMDDAYISYRYAWNFVHGSGLVYNPGEVVEGYTNFLWTTISAAALWAGQHPAHVSLALTIACSQGLVGLAYLLSRKLMAHGPEVLAFVAAVLVAVDSSLVTYGARGSGIEAALFAFLIMLGVAFLWSSGPRAPALYATGGLVLGLAALTRPEGLLVAVLAIGLRAWQVRWKREAVVWMALPCLALIVPYQAWRITYYGYLFPNTFYAKTGTTLAQVQRGLEYAWQFVTDHWLIVLCLLVGLPIAFFQKIPNRGKKAVIDPHASEASIASDLRMLLGVLVVVYSLYVIAVGGDWFPAERFFVPVVVPLALLATDSIRMLAGTLAPRAQLRRVTLALAGALVIAYAGAALWSQRQNGELAHATMKETYIVENWGAAGVWLRTQTPPQTIIAVEAAGAIAYYSRLYVIDGFGLNDLHIAHLQVADMGTGLAGHEKKDPAYVLDRKPDYILAFWEGYFAPVAARLNATFQHVTERSPTGQDFEWLKADVRH